MEKYSDLMNKINSNYLKEKQRATEENLKSFHGFTREKTMLNVFGSFDVGH